MAMSEILQGCGDDSWGYCVSEAESPSLMSKATGEPLGALEGPPASVPIKICSASGKCQLQEKCSAYRKRIIADNQRDMNL